MFRVIFAGILLLLLLVLEIPVTLVYMVVVYVLHTVPRFVVLTFVYGCAILASFVVAVADFVTNGSLRRFARNEEHPDAWWRLSSFHEGNRPHRVFGTLLPCASGFKPVFGNLFCSRVSSCVPVFSPSALLVQNYHNYWFAAPFAKSLTHPTYLPYASDSCSGARVDYYQFAKEFADAVIEVNGVDFAMEAVNEMVAAAAAARVHIMAWSGMDPHQMAMLAKSALDDEAGARIHSYKPFNGKAFQREPRDNLLAGFAGWYAIMLTVAGLAALHVAARTYASRRPPLLALTPAAGG